MTRLIDDALADTVRAHLAAARARTHALTELGEDDLTAQHSRLMSPLVWDMAHIANYEELWLVRALGGTPVAPELDRMYDAFENARADRPSLALLSPDEARDYQRRVRESTLGRLEALDRLPPEVDQRLLAGGAVYGMVVQHEHMHDETMLATRQLMGQRSTPPPGSVITPAEPPTGSAPVTAGEVEIPPGTYRIGVDRDREPWAFDNELPAHDREIGPFAIDVTAVTNGAYQGFIEAGGYDEEALWSPAGWRWRIDEGLEAPRFWTRTDSGWTVERFGRTVAVDPCEPVQHVCWYEADAYARWAGKRLPTEFEWEVAASVAADGTKLAFPWGDHADDLSPANLGQRRDGPDPVGAHPAGVSPWGCHGMIGDVWEWTSSIFQPYPGFEAYPYPEYSEVFWDDGYRVLRGGCWAVDPVAIRATFRNWDFPIRRQIFCGFRCARDLS